MTIGKIPLRCVALLLVLLFLSASFLSCNRPFSEPPFELLDPKVEQGTAMNFSLYRIVLPTTCTSALFTAANEFSLRLTERTGVRSEVVYDQETVGATEGVFEIILGNAERQNSKKKLANLRHNDYLCYAEEGFAVLGGKSEQATLAALNRFYQELFSYVTAYSFLPSSVGFSYRAEYPIGEIILNGFDLSEYAIVYSNGSSGTQERLARDLHQILCTASGYDLPLSSEQEFTKDRKQIFLSLTSEVPSGNVHLLPNESGITLSAPDTYGLSVGARALCDRLLTPSAENKVILELSASETLFYQNRERSLASLWLSPEDSEIATLSFLTDRILENSPDVIFLPTASDVQQESLRESITPLYSATENAHLFQRENVCRFGSDLSTTLGVPATLYQIGSDLDGFLLLELNGLPAGELPVALQERTLPLLLVIHSENVRESQSFPIGSGFERAVSETYTQGATRVSFDVYADRDCFTVTPSVGSNGYRSFTVSRASVLFVP